MMHEMNTPQGELRALIARWQRGEGVGRHLTAMKHLEAREASWGPLPEGLNPSLVRALRDRGVERLYSHQSEALGHVLSGRHTVVVTPTASGKSLCYNLPVLDAMYRGASALYLFPTKALSQDQTAELNEFIRAVPDRDASWEAQVYDGDTPPDVRRRIRRNARLVITNPDMLHAGIMPHHEKWANFFRALEFVVIDELHTYRGVFGSHVANVVRRLRRICEHYGASPTFVATSATIANPRELAEVLVDAPFEVVDENGAPAAERWVCFFNPPITDVQQMRRQSSLKAAERVAKETIKRRCGTIVFARSRQSVEVLVHRLKGRLERERGNKNLQDRIASYRGGYLPELRRSIERGLRDGHVLGVISTNALELGIDIGSLDVCVLAGYPGSVASTWQQIGRAGRSGGTSLAVVIAGDDPVDQFIIQNPHYFFGQSPEAARVDPRNLLIAVEHLKCACYELPFGAGERFGALSPEETREALEFLEAETGMLCCADGSWKWSDQTYPASEINLRNIADENFVVIDITHARPNVVAEVDFEGAHTALYPRAVYQISGAPYRVERLDYDERRAYVRRSDDGYYTTAMHYSSVHVLDVFKEKPAPPATIGFGEVRVTERFVGYKKIKFGTGENVGYGEINLPELDLHTMSYWAKLPTDHFPDLAGTPERWARVVNGAGKVLKTAASLKLMCDPRDLDLCIGSVDDDRWLSEGFEGLTVRDSQGEAHAFGEGPVAGAKPDGAVESGRIGPVLYDPTIFIYDQYPGGVGFGEGLFDEHRDFVELARELIAGCSCARGCPSCVGPPEVGKDDIKADVSQLLGRVAFVQ